MSDIYPPDYVNIPARMMYDKKISPALRDTYCQLRGLAWKSGYKKTPAYTFKELAELLGKSASVLYEHVHALRRTGWLLFSQLHSVAYTFSFPEPPNSTSSFYENSERCLLKGSVNCHSKESVDIGINAISENSEKMRDPSLDHEAVRIYRRLTHITANPVQRDHMVRNVDNLPLWEEVINHWLGHGWSKMNVTGMIDSFKKGGKAGCSLCLRANAPTNGNGHKPAGRDVISEAAEMARRKRMEGER